VSDDYILAAELAAEGLRARLGVTDGVADPFAALAQLGVAVLRRPLKVDGVYRRVDDQAFAAINSLTDVTRQRFTAAHELGHHLLYDDTMPASLVDVDLSGPATDGPNEAATDAFAAAFLMPEAEVRAVAVGAADGFTAIIRTMHHFDVSKPAAARRCLGMSLATEEDAARLAKDRTKLADLFTAAGLTPRPKRSMGQRSVDPRHLARVRRLVRAGVVEDPILLLDLT
jgi:Zn-dependent peptidase ImmA (M78 family)